MTVSLDGEDTTQVAPHSERHALVRGLREPVRQHPRRGRHRRRRPRSTSGPGTSSRRAGTTDSSRRWSAASGSPFRSSTTPAPSSPANEDPHGNNTEGNGSPGPPAASTSSTSRCTCTTRRSCPAGATDVRFRYSTDAAYLDTGWFVDDVMVNGAAADGALGRGRVVRDDRAPGQQLDAAGRRVLRPHAGRRTRRSRSRTAQATTSTGSRATRSRRRDSTPSAPTARTATSRRWSRTCPTGDLTFLDADYVLTGEEHRERQEVAAAHSSGGPRFGAGRRSRVFPPPVEIRLFRDGARALTLIGPLGSVCPVNPKSPLGACPQEVSPR